MIGAIFATDEHNGFGVDNKIPWHISDDFKHFKNVTNGSKLVMGKNTFESLPGLLPNREHFVLSRTLTKGEGYTVHGDLYDLVTAAGNNFWVIGGPSIIDVFGEVIGYDVVYHSVVRGKHDADVTYDPSNMLATMELYDTMSYEKFEVLKYINPVKF